MLDGDPQNLGDVVVLLDELLAEPVVCGCLQDRLFEFGVLV